MGTARRGSVKAGAVVAAALFGVLTPGIGPVTAAAQEEPSGEEQSWAPTGPWAPKTPPGGPPKDTGEPDEIYVPEVDCITSSTEGHKNVAANALKEAPPAQKQLRLREVHNYVRRHSPAGKIGADKNTGKPLRVAVIDTGVTPGIFFQNRIKPGGDYVQKTDGREDCDGHGTQVAGIIGANPQKVNDDIAFTGVAPDVEIISIRQSSQNFRPETEDEKKQKEEDRKREQELARDKREAERRAAELEAKTDQLEKEQEELDRRQDEEADKKTDSSQGGEQDPRAQGSGAGNQGTLAQAIVNAVDKKVDVINMSVDACRPNDGSGQVLEQQEKDLQAAIHYAFKQDVVVVAAAGNVGGSCVQNDEPEKVTQPGQPANQEVPGKMPDPNQPPTVVTPPWFTEDLLAVAAVDEFGGVADFSMRGPWVSVAAPGTKIISVDPVPRSELLVSVTFDGEGGAQELKGTSFASPYVAGLAVLVRQMHPELSARQVMDRIMRTAQHPGARDGHDQFVGYGMIDPMAALTATFPDEIGIEPAADRQLGSDMPPLVVEDDTPMIVALAGSGGALAALGVTLFIVRTVRRRDDKAPEATT